MQWLAEICVHRPVFATVIVLFLTVVGGFAFFTLGVDRFPKIDLPTVSVRTTNTGAAPEEIETEITDIIEGALNTVPGIDEMRSTSSRGSSNITVTFNLEKDPDQAFQEIQQKLSTVTNRLPETADPPVGRKVRPGFAAGFDLRHQCATRHRRANRFGENQIQERIESCGRCRRSSDFLADREVKQIRIYLIRNACAPTIFRLRKSTTPFAHRIRNCRAAIVNRRRDRRSA